MIVLYRERSKKIDNYQIPPLELQEGESQGVTLGTLNATTPSRRPTAEEIDLVRRIERRAGTSVAEVELRVCRWSNVEVSRSQQIPQPLLGIVCSDGIAVAPGIGEGPFSGRANSITSRLAI
jgi:hypothetical protein